MLGEDLLWRLAVGMIVVAILSLTKANLSRFNNLMDQPNAHTQSYTNERLPSQTIATILNFCPVYII
jgi:hypothetical protein